MTRNARLRVAIEISTATLMLLTLATAVARRPGKAGAPVVDQAVILNSKTRKFHCPVCDLVRHCGPDCATVDLSEAVRRGARPCEICGGVCVANSGRPAKR